MSENGYLDLLNLSLVWLKFQDSRLESDSEWIVHLNLLHIMQINSYKSGLICS